MADNKTTIVINVRTRENLRHVAKKYQTYDDIIKELLEQKNENDSPSLAELRESKKVEK